MAWFTPVAEAGDPRLVPYTAMTDADHRRRLEAASGTFLVEGVTAIRRAATSPYPLRSLLLTPGRAAALTETLDRLDVEVFVAEPDVMRAVTGFDIHRGAVAVAARRPLPPLSAMVAGARTIVVLEGVNDHENLGAIARTAAVLGVDGLVVDPTCADPLDRRCVRVSVGEVLHIPFTRAEPWPGALDTLRRAGLAVVALTPSPDAEPVDAVAARCRPGPVALLLGAEGPGLSAAALAGADHRARIPLRPGADSLNVGHAAAIALYVFTR